MEILLFVIIFIVSLAVEYRLKAKAKKYSAIRIYSGLTGKEIAQKMLYENGLTDVRITSVDGQLTDHYNPVNKTINLSHDVYAGDSVMAAAVAAHETGHAIQHAQAYSFLQMRSALVPIVSFSSRIVQWILLAGILLLGIFPQLLLIGIILFALTTIFSFITLPVEFDASRRALAWLESGRHVNSAEHAYAKDALKWAAMTYVVAAVGSLATLLYYVLVFLGSQRDE